MKRLQPPRWKSRTAPVAQEVETLDAARTVLGLLPKLAGLAAGLTILGLVIGWQQANSYYRNLGAPWAAGQLSPADLLKLGGTFMIPFAIASLLSVLMLMDKSITFETLRRIVIGLVLLAMCTFGLPESWLGSTFKFGAMGIGVSAVALSAGVGAALIVGSLARTGLEWRSGHIWTLYLTVGMSLWQGPVTLGYTLARSDSNLTTSRLPFVRIRDSGDPVKSWRLVAAVEKGFLVVQLTPQRNGRIFRLISPTDLNAIESTDE